jgi:hypothetical protein
MGSAGVPTAVLSKRRCPESHEGNKQSTHDDRAKYRLTKQKLHF